MLYYLYSAKTDNQSSPHKGHPKKKKISLGALTSSVSVLKNRLRNKNRPNDATEQGKDQLDSQAVKKAIDPAEAVAMEEAIYSGIDDFSPPFADITASHNAELSFPIVGQQDSVCIQYAELDHELCSDDSSVSQERD